MNERIERFKPGFLKERSAINAQQEAIGLARQRGISVDLLQSLGRTQSEIDLNKKSNKAFWIGLAAGIVGTAAFGYSYQISDESTLDQFYADLIGANLKFFTDITSNKIKDIVKGVAIADMVIAYGYIILSWGRKRVDDSVDNLGKKLRLKEESDTLRLQVEKGELPIDIGPGHVVIGLGDGDAIGSALGRKLGWTRGAIPLIEREENVSDSPLWVKVHNPTHAVKKDEFFASLDRARFDTASSFVICSLNQDQAFLPNSGNRAHFDLRPSEILAIIALAGDYCRKRGLPMKKIIVIGDKTVKSAVGPSYGSGKIKPISEFSLEELIAQINEGREEEVIIADPTEIALQALASEELNPRNLPLEFYEDPDADEKYDARFIERGKALRIDVIESEDDKRESLKIVYGDRDVDTALLAGMIDGKLSSYLETVSVIIDEARAIGEPHNTIVLSNVVSDWVSERLRIPQETAAA